MSKLPNPNQKGYTLIELLLVVALLGLLAGYAIPNFLNFNLKATLNKNTNLIVDDLRATKSFAQGGIQTSSSKLGSYRFELLPGPGDPIGFYRGYRILRIDELGNPVLPVLEEKTLECNICATATWQTTDFDVPSGNTDISGSSRDVRVCSPELGYYDVSIDSTGNIEHSDYMNGSGLCNCNSICGGTSIPTPTTIPTNTPIPTPTSIPPTSTPTPSPTPSTSNTSIGIRARGTFANGLFAQMKLQVNGLDIQNWTTTDTYQDYLVSVVGTVTPDQIKVHFTNDYYGGTPATDRNLIVDYITVNSVTYQSESSSTYSTGTWTSDTGCGAGYKQSESLDCGGYFQYSAIAGPSPTPIPQTYSLDFDGTDDYVGTTSTELHNLNNFTISLWFKADTTANPAHILWEGISSGNGWGEGSMNVPELSISIGGCCSAVGNKLSFHLGDTDTSYSAGVLYIATDFTDTTNWHHVAVVVSDMSSTPSATLYLDGNLIGTDTGTAARTGRTTPTSWNTALRLGRPGAAQRFFNGKIDEVRIYSRVLSQAEIQSDMSININPATSGLTSYWKFNEGTGQVASDSTGDLTNGTLGSSTSTVSDDPSWSTTTPF